ncbi:hypothetical protein BS47DRAFT_1297208, partial [Hydnum rufescens UP504]
CKEIVEELEKCREAGFINRYFGGCNDVKRKLNLCLRAERAERTARHIEKSRRENKSPEEAWRRHIEKEGTNDP